MDVDATGNDVRAHVQEVPDRIDPDVIRQRLDYWTLVLGPKFSKRVARCSFLSPGRKDALTFAAGD